MEEKSTVKIALIRGNSLNEWEGNLWGLLKPPFVVTGFCGKKNGYDIKNLPFSTRILTCSSDHRIKELINRYLFAKSEEFIGLEKELKQYDIAHTAEIFNFYTLQAVRAKKLNPKLKVICTVWDNSVGRLETTWGRFATTPPTFWYKRATQYVQEAIKGVDLFLSVSDATTTFLIERGVPQTKIKKVMPAVLSGENDDDALLFIKNNQLETGAFYILVNRLVREKGIYDVFYAWKELFMHNQIKRKLLIIGNGPEKNNIVRLVKFFNVEKSVVFAKSIPNVTVKSLYKHARALILGSLPTPIWQEQFGYVLAEAMSAHTPVISTKSGAIPEVVGSAGILVSPGSVAELKKAIISMEDDEAHEQFKLQCEQERKRFLQERFVSDLIDSYKIF